MCVTPICWSMLQLLGLRVNCKQVGVLAFGLTELWILAILQFSGSLFFIKTHTKKINNWNITFFQTFVMLGIFSVLDYMLMWSNPLFYSSLQHTPHCNWWLNNRLSLNCDNLNQVYQSSETLKHAVQCVSRTGAEKHWLIVEAWEHLCAPTAFVWRGDLFPSFPSPFCRKLKPGHKNWWIQSRG